MNASSTTSDIAIIGMACRFPGADTPAAFWRNLCNGVESITFFSSEELAAAGVEPTVLDDPNYVKAAPILSGADQFDATFFAYSPKEATIMDPQHRLFLEVAWEACEDAGYHPETYPGAIGLFAGAGGVLTSYLMAHPGHPALGGQTGGLEHIGNDKDFLATRVAYKLNLTGPVVTVQTACSTSMVAVHLACQSLLNGECDMVLAGAATVRVPHRRGYWVEKGNINSPDGHCRAFDAQAQGTVFGSGVGAVLLKRVERAVADGDPIYAVIKGTAINNDGAHKVSYTASSVAGQARAMVEALTLADVSAETLQYVECHGTGTIVGDPLEIQALTRAFRLYTTDRGFAAVGSVKTNIGHLEQTAGLASLMKTALTLHHGAIPASLHLHTPNPKIDFERSPFYVNTAYCPWPTTDTPRRAAVNSLGLGGTNTFAVLEAAPETRRGLTPVSAPPHLFSLSAKSEPALVAYAERVAAALDDTSESQLADICYTTNVSRSYFSHRFAATTDTIGDLRQHLVAFASGTPPSRDYRHVTSKPPVVFLFTGQGAQYPRMAVELYDTEPVFREALDQCDAGWLGDLDPPLLEILLSQSDSTDRLHETTYTQPALFAVEYALAKLWQSWGVVPDAVIGHSIGELAAACVAGVLEFDDALDLVAQRGRLMQSVSVPGAMAAVFAAETVVQAELLPYAGQVSIAAVNSPQNTVISGDREAVSDVINVLRAKGIPSRALAVSHAFHSPLMEPILDAFETIARDISYRAPRIPLVSNVTGDWLETAPDASYWREHIRQPVRFAHGLQTVASKWDRAVWVEIGPGRSLLSIGQQGVPHADATWLASLDPRQPGRQTLMESLKALYLVGVPIDWQGVHREGHRCALPTYPFQRQRYWLDPAPPYPALGIRATPSHALRGSRLRSGLDAAQFEALYGVEQLPYLADHRIYDWLVLPTTAGLEAAMAAGQVIFNTADLRLDHLIYHEARVFEVTTLGQLIYHRAPRSI